MQVQSCLKDAPGYGHLILQEKTVKPIIPTYTPPDFNAPPLKDAPAAAVVPAPIDGVAPDNFHGTSNHPEYAHLGGGNWLLAPESRMDCVIVLKGREADVVEARRLKKGDPVVVGRTENGEEGIFVHTKGFALAGRDTDDKFTFRTRGTRETPFSRSYDQLYDILRHDRDHGNIVWVLGPAVAFDKDSRDAMQGLIESGYCHALMAGNALATHDLEAAYFQTGLGQNIYTQELQPLGHYNHLDILNLIRREGSIKAAIKDLDLQDGIIYACEKGNIPYVLAGSIRDDGPLPEITPNVYDAQDRMRTFARKATTVITLATQLHSIAFGNMTPAYRIMDDQTIRPVFFYIVDMSEFSADKLANRGSGQAVAILTNVQDFMINLWNNLAKSG
jgi:lysine-ketoglutarate reductase/saccharopine dehydrogenase-like protein (TIGR00300 family)